MRLGRLLMASLGAAVLGAGVAAAPAAEEFSTDGLVSLESAGDGATVIVTGWLSQEKFELKDVRIAGSRLAGKAGDPDQFRITLLDREGRRLGTVKTWSPLLSLQWDAEGLKESAQGFTDRVVEILIPASLTLSQVAFTWTESKYEVARVDVGEVVYRFCKEMPDNPACRR
jgi:hypothetical protein